MAGRNLMHPRQPELVGRDLWDMRDVNGSPVIQNLIARAREGGGFVHYMWNKPSAGNLAPKLGYAVGLPRWNWMLGTGIYLDDVQATMAQIDRQVNANVTATMWWIAGIAVLAIALTGVCGVVLNVSESRIADAKLRLLARQVVQTQEAERAHLSRELHDSTSQTLVSIKLLMESAIARMGSAAPPALPKALERLKAALGEVRNISHRLRPAELDVLGLPAALVDRRPPRHPLAAGAHSAGRRCAGRVAAAVRVEGSSMTPTRLLIVDDHPLVREGLKARLSAVPSVEVVGEAGNAQEAATQLAQARPDLVLMDVGMKDVNGIELTRRLLADRPDLLVLILSMYDNPEYVNRAMQAGARGYVLKDAPASDIVDAIAAVAAGGTFLSPAVSGR